VCGRVQPMNCELSFALAVDPFFIFYSLPHSKFLGRSKYKKIKIVSQAAQARRR
jgi:hypothetical protein